MITAKTWIKKWVSLMLIQPVNTLFFLLRTSWASYLIKELFKQTTNFKKSYHLNIKEWVSTKNLLMYINVLLASLLKGISAADQKCSVMKDGRCAWINPPELLDSADKQNLLCQRCQHIAQFGRGGGEGRGRRRRKRRRKRQPEPK